jgi:hypothetical protein
MLRSLLVATLLLACSCGSGAGQSCGKDAPSMLDGVATDLAPPDAKMSCVPRPWLVVLNGFMTASNRVYDNQGNLVGVDERATVTDVRFDTGDLGEGEPDVFDFSYRVLSENGDVLTAWGGNDPFTCYDCKSPWSSHADGLGGSPLISGMAFYEILDRRFNEVLLLLDLRGYLQVFCMNNPCADFCQPGMDGGNSDVGQSNLDAGIAEFPIPSVATDAGATDVSID